MNPQPFSVGVFVARSRRFQRVFAYRSQRAAPSTMAWLNPLFIANTAYHHTGMFTIAA